MMKHVVYDRYPIGNKRFIWKQKDFKLSTFAGVPVHDCGEGVPKEFVDKHVRHLKEAGFNMMELGWVKHENAWLAVDACEKQGLDLLFQDMSIMGGMNKYCLENKVPYEVVEDLVNRLKDKKHVIGYYVWDEPCTGEQLHEARRQMDMLEKAAPEALLFTVAIPSYNLEGENGEGFHWENGLYEPYVEKFVREMDPPVLSFDYYPIGDYWNAWYDHTFVRENQLDDSFIWLDMALHRKLALEKELPFWFYYQGYPLYAQKDFFIFPIIRSSMYGAILYGAKGLSHYAVGEPKSLVLKSNGDKDIFFEEMKKIHGEISAMGDTLMALSSKMVYHSADLLPDCEYMTPLVDKVEDSDIFTGELPRRTSVGELEDAYGNRYVIILNRDFEAPLSGEIEMKDEFRVYEVSREDGKQRVAYENTTLLPVCLAPGDAVILRIQKAREEAFTIKYKLAE